MTPTTNDQAAITVRNTAIAPGSSVEQQEAEDIMIDLLGKSLGVSLVKKGFRLPAGGWLEIDGYCESPRILREAWAHIGIPKSAQKNKVTADAMKLLFAASLNPGEHRLILAFADDAAANHFRGNSWIAEALKAKCIETVVVELPSGLRQRVLLAQKRQFR